MNQKDYKEIANIIKYTQFDIKSDGYTETDLDMINGLADYFEKEYQDKLERNMGKIYGKGQPIEFFNKQQFLKDCERK